MSCTVHSPADSLAQPTCILVYIECNPAPGGSPFELSLGLRSNSRVLLPPSLLRASCVVVCPRFCLGSPQEGTAYGSSRHTGAMNPPLRVSFYVFCFMPCQNGPYIVNQGRDDHTMSWLPLPVRSLVADHSGRFQGISAQPRKQIIGFAKFCTHQEALEAKKVLEGHRIDAKNDTVLRVEMAKKNLHTKRSAPHW